MLQVPDSYSDFLRRPGCLSKHFWQQKDQNRSNRSKSITHSEVISFGLAFLMVVILDLEPSWAFSSRAALIPHPPPQLRLCRQLLDRDPKKRPSADEVPVNFMWPSGNDFPVKTSGCDSLLNICTQRSLKAKGTRNG